MIDEGKNVKRNYTSELNELLRWMNNTNQVMIAGMQPVSSPQEVGQIKYLINSIVKEIQGEYPFYADVLPEISNILFLQNTYGAITVNPAAFGELFIILRHLDAEPSNLQWWLDIHPRICNISKDLYADGHYASAAEKAIKEVETRLREKFSELKPNSTVPAKVGDIIGALFSENGVFKFCDTSTQSGKDYRRGIQSLFEGTMSAYRNPAAHANLSFTKREAVEQIVLASQLVYVLDKPCI